MVRLREQIFCLNPYRPLPARGADRISAGGAFHIELQVSAAEYQDILRRGTIPGVQHLSRPQGYERIEKSGAFRDRQFWMVRFYRQTPALCFEVFA